MDIDDFVDASNFKMVDSSWADIMEDEDVVAPSMHVSLPSAPKSVQGPDIDFNAIPANGPFRAQVANLQYEVNEDQLSELFTGLSVSSSQHNDHVFVLASILTPTTNFSLLDRQLACEH